MVENEILKEVYAIKDQISAEINKDPDKYFRGLARDRAKFKKMGIKFVEPGKFKRRKKKAS
jgi:hypothetical protein